MTKEKNYYEILEIPTDATPDQVYEGYLRAKNAYSQDSLALYSLMTKEECDEIINLIDEAYSIISDPSKRRQYDEVRGIKSSGHNQSSFADAYSSARAASSAQSQVKEGSKLSKIVATNRYSLEYDEDSEFEQLIEQTTEFTGEFLHKIREYKGVDLPRMADMTKVSKTYITHIENEAHDKLPALVYVRGFVYQYAKCLKLNPDLVATSYIYRLKKIKGEA